MARLGICFATSEMAPYAKVGGLGDVSGALPKYLHRKGLDVRVFLPLYSRIYDQAERDFKLVDFARHVPVSLGSRTVHFDLYYHPGGGERPDVYFVHCPAFFGRPEMYGGGSDEHLRFVLLCRAVIESCQRMGWAPHVFHCNDWHTSLIPIYLKTFYSWDRLFERSKTLLSIHNIGYQGVIPASALSDISLSDYWTWLDQGDLREGRIGLLKTGLIHADIVSTVSPTYAREICYSSLGMGLEGLLRQRSDAIFGILNGVDYNEWSPDKDPLIPFPYSAEDLSGKVKNRDHLLEKLGLLPADEGPVVGIVSRMTSQKGFELLFEPLPWMMRRRKMRLVVLGSGDPTLESFFVRLQRQFPGRACFYRGYSNELAHLIEAGSDLFLMPSLYEPCGLNQMYSLRYGSVPLVRKTGGLADTVQLFDAETGQGTGFVFEHFNSEGLAWGLDYALNTYDRPKLWEKVRANGMRQDFSWEKQALVYIDLYSRLSGVAAT